MKLISREFQSPNYNDRPTDCNIDTIVIHYTGMQSADAALQQLCDAEKQVSAHYLIYENGNIFQLVDESKRAWHAGVSSWRGRDNVNDFSIGIELANKGHEFGYHPFPKEQMLSLIELIGGIQKRNILIEKRNIIGHSDIAPSRKTDPGELFDWQELADNNIGIFPKTGNNGQIEHVVEIGQNNDRVKKIQRNLSNLGYKISADGYFGVETSYVVEAFQRHFTPYRLDGIWDKNADAILGELINLS